MTAEVLLSFQDVYYFGGDCGLFKEMPGKKKFILKVKIAVFVAEFFSNSSVSNNTLIKVNYKQLIKAKKHKIIC